MIKRFSFKQHPHLTRKVYKSMVNIKKDPTIEIKKDKETKAVEENKIVEDIKTTTKAKTITNTKVVENKENKTESNE